MRPLFWYLVMLSFLQFLLPAIAVLCFGYGAVLCVVRTVRGTAAPAFAPAGRRAVVQAGLVCLAAALAIQAVFLLACRLRWPDLPLAQSLPLLLYGNTDARHYIDLAQYGYGSGEAFPEQYLMIVFFPGFPALLRFLNPLGLPIWQALALAVQPPLFALGGAGLYAVTARQLGADTARRTAAFLVVWPAAFFFAAPMTESLFLALAVWYVWAWEREHYALASALGLLAGLTRSPGGLLFGLAVLHAVALRRRPTAESVVATLSPAAGLGLYFALNYAVYGRWNQFSQYQWEHWHQRLGLFTGTLRYQLGYAAAWWQDNRASALWICIVCILCILGSFGLLALAARRLPPHWLGFGLAYLTVTMGATWLLSAPRYAAALFCLPAALACLLQGRPRLTRVVWCLTALGSGIYFAAWLAGMPIY